MSNPLPDFIPNWINGVQARHAQRNNLKLNPHDGQVLAHVARSRETDVDDAVRAADQAQIAWATFHPSNGG